MDCNAEKKALRAKLNAMPPVDWQPMLDEFLNLPQVAEARSLLLFAGVGREPDTTTLIDALLVQGKVIALPTCLPHRQMEGRQIGSRADLAPGPYGIPQGREDCPVLPPASIDLILVPNLCCDTHGYRLGHGGGYYDRYLAGYQGFTVALCPKAWLQTTVPRDEYDLPVNLVISS